MCTGNTESRTRNKGKLHTPHEGEGPAGGLDDLLLCDYAKGCEHGNTSVSQLGLAPPPDISNGTVARAGTAQEVQWVEDVWEGV